MSYYRGGSRGKSHMIIGHYYEGTGNIVVLGDKERMEQMKELGIGLTRYVFKRVEYEENS